ncbi:hypothetical protein V1224_11050 [Lachnospiraceae bacterium JLR.KK008]
MRKIRLLAIAATLSMLFSVPVSAAEWKQEPDGRVWYQYDDGSRPAGKWEVIGDKMYYFDAEGYIHPNAVTPDGKMTGADGSLVPGSSVSNITYSPDCVTTSLFVNDYLYENMFATYHIFEVTNLSPYTIRLTVNDAAKNAAGVVIGAAKTSEEDIPSGSTVFVRSFFNDVSGVVSFDTTFQVKEEDRYLPVLQGIVYQTADIGDKVTVTAVNMGDKPAEFTEATAVFFKDGKVVYCGTDYLTDADYELKPGATISGQINAYGREYDTVKVYLTARRSKWSK